MTKKKYQAFTLIELLVVVAIIGLLAALAMIALNTARAKARDARRVADVRQVQTALEMYFLDQSGFPADPTGSNTFETLSLCSNRAWTNDVATCTGGTVYIARAPSNPSPRNDGDCTGNRPYSYYQDSSGTSYHIRYCIGSAVSDISAGLHTATPAGLQ